MFNYLQIRKSRFLKKSASRTQKKNDKPLFSSEYKTGHNSGSWPPLEIKSSALDRIFHAGSNGNSFKAWNLQNNLVFKLF